MKPAHNKLNPIARRDFMMRTAQAALGVTVMPSLNLAAAGTTGAGTPGFGKAKNVIFLWMGGGMTHIDTWDPKDGATKGPTDPIKANSGSGNMDRLGGTMEKMAKVANKIWDSRAPRRPVHDCRRFPRRRPLQQRPARQSPTPPPFPQPLAVARRRCARQVRHPWAGPPVLLPQPFCRAGQQV